MYGARIMLMGEEWLQWIDIPDEGIGAVKEEVQVLTAAEKGGVKLGFKEEEEDEEKVDWFQQMVAGVEAAEKAHVFLNPAYISFLNPISDEGVGVISNLKPNLRVAAAAPKVEGKEEDMFMGPQWKKRRICLPPFHSRSHNSRCRIGKKNPN